MEHLQDEPLFNLVFDGMMLSSQAAEHLDVCDACQQRMEELGRLHQELAVARRSTVSPAAHARYVALFAEVEQQAQSTAARLGAWLSAALTWDSRSAAPAAGIRSGAGAAYRLLYAAGELEVELMVEPERGMRRVEGEVIGLDDSGGVALIDLAPVSATGPHWSVQGTSQGRFGLGQIEPGVYRLTVTPVSGAVVEIEPLDLT